VLQRYGEIDGWAFLDALHHNIARYTQGNETPCALVADGEKPIGISYDLEGIDLKSKGKSIEVVFPVGLSNWDMEASALVKKEPIQPAAKTFLDWAISKTAMRGYAKNYSLISRKDVEVRVPEGYPQEPGRQLFDRDFLWDAANRQRILQTLRERYSDKVPKKPDRGEPS
jgi:iron(III) transport system substrate-binding protein